MRQINKCMALELIEDALTDTSSPYGCGLASGLCGAFYMCGLLSMEEWKAFLDRLPAKSYEIGGGEIYRIGSPETKAAVRTVN